MHSRNVKCVRVWHLRCYVSNTTKQAKQELWRRVQRSAALADIAQIVSWMLRLFWRTLAWNNFAPYHIMSVHAANEIRADSSRIWPGNNRVREQCFASALQFVRHAEVKITQKCLAFIKILLRYIPHIMTKNDRNKMPTAIEQRKYFQCCMNNRARRGRKKHYDSWRPRVKYDSCLCLRKCEPLSAHWMLMHLR